MPFGTLDMAIFMEEWPLHMVLYEIDEESLTRHNQRHLESCKHYYVDLLGWSNRQDCSHLQGNYKLIDASSYLENAAYARALQYSLDKQRSTQHLVEGSFQQTRNALYAPLQEVSSTLMIVLICVLAPVFLYMVWG